jgi:hypothetical protein
MAITESRGSIESTSHIQSQLRLWCIKGRPWGQRSPLRYRAYLLRLKRPFREVGVPPSCDKIKKFTCSPATRLHYVGASVQAELSHSTSIREGRNVGTRGDSNTAPCRRVAWHILHLLHWPSTQLNNWQDCWPKGVFYFKEDRYTSSIQAKTKLATLSLHETGDWL